MERLEPIQKPQSLSWLLRETKVNGTIEIHADRLASFKSSVSRFNGMLPKTEPKYNFSYSGIQDNKYVIATRIS